MTSAFKSYVNGTGSSSGAVLPSSYGQIYVAGSGALAVGSITAYWSDNDNSVLSLQTSKGASVDAATGTITLNQAGTWKIAFNTTVDGTAATVQTYTLEKDGAVNLKTAQTSTDAGGPLEKRNTLIQVIDDAVVAGSTYRIKVENDAGMRFLTSSFVAEQIA